jgi:hypothetical protein
MGFRIWIDGTPKGLDFNTLLEATAAADQALEAFREKDRVRRIEVRNPYAGLVYTASRKPR